MYNADIVDLSLSLQKPTEYGDIMFSLSYLPTAERLTIVIVKARNLKWADSSRDYGGQWSTSNWLRKFQDYPLDRFLSKSCAIFKIYIGRNVTLRFQNHKF